MISYNCTNFYAHDAVYSDIFFGYTSIHGKIIKVINECNKSNCFKRYFGQRMTLKVTLYFSNIKSLLLRCIHHLNWIHLLIWTICAFRVLNHLQWSLAKIILKRKMTADLTENELLLEMQNAWKKWHMLVIFDVFGLLNLKIISAKCSLSGHPIRVNLFQRGETIF